MISKEISSQSTENKSILIVDDNVVNRKIIEKTLSKYGYKVSVSESGIDAIRLLTKVHHDLILMDIEMPDLDGFQATKAIRAIHDEFIPIIGYSTLSGAKNLSDAKNAGMSDYIHKPARPDEILEIIERNLELVQNSTDLIGAARDFIEKLLALTWAYIYLYKSMENIVKGIRHTAFQLFQSIPKPTTIVQLIGDGLDALLSLSDAEKAKEETAKREPVVEDTENKRG
jgi:CheY-like chemotaxis protein